MGSNLRNEIQAIQKSFTDYSPLDAVMFILENRDQFSDIVVKELDEYISANIQIYN
jgi:hypothetical protein